MKNTHSNLRQPLLLANPVFISSLLLLLLNDFVFKPVYHNWLTGKLSDISGVIVLALLLAYLFPKLKGKASLLSAVVFTLWKLPLSNPLIHWCNISLNLPVHRTIDYTDLFALAVLPFTYLYIHHIKEKTNALTWPVWSKNLLLIIGSLACMATAMSPKQHAGYDGIEVNRSYPLAVTKATALDRLKALGYSVKTDSTYSSTDRKYYLIRQVVLDQNDTLKNIRFKLEDNGTKSKLTIESVQAPHRVDRQTFRKVRKRYEALVEAGIIDKAQE
jgi:hypothetical protein